MMTIDMNGVALIALVSALRLGVPILVMLLLCKVIPCFYSDAPETS